MCVSLKENVLEENPLEPIFRDSPLPTQLNMIKTLAVQAAMLTFEGIIERIIFNQYSMSKQDEEVILTETGTPCGWYPLLSGYDELAWHGY